MSKMTILRTLLDMEVLPRLLGSPRIYLRAARRPDPRKGCEALWSSFGVDLPL